MRAIDLAVQNKEVAHGRRFGRRGVGQYLPINLAALLQSLLLVVRVVHEFVQDAALPASLAELGEV
jgi:hypothetical protein